MGNLFTTKEIISSLIDLGPDAHSNLFTIKLSGLNSFIFSKNIDKTSTIGLRTTTFLSPTRDSESKSLPYQNIDINIPSPATTIPRNLDLTVRVDAGYEGYAALRQLQLINSNGLYYRDEKKCIDKMEVTAYESSGNLIPVYKWTFYKLFLLKLSRFSYSYNDSTALTCNVSFIWSRYEEGPILNVDSGIADKLSIMSINPTSGAKSTTFSGAVKDSISLKSSFDFSPNNMK